MEKSGAPVPRERHATEFLANERTFLAWIRTSIAVVSLGFVVARFSVWLRQLTIQLHGGPQVSHIGVSLPFGLAMMALGAILAPLAGWRYHVVNRKIEEGEVTADRGLIVMVTVIVAGLAIGMIVYLAIVGSSYE
jgi:putative membrane protein